jgi:hypothetical protein
MTDTMKPNEKQGAENKVGNLEYNPVNMAGKKAAGVKELDEHNAEEKVLPIGGADENAVGKDVYNPVNMAGRKAGGKKAEDKARVPPIKQSEES